MTHMLNVLGDYFWQMVCALGALGAAAGALKWCKPVARLFKFIGRAVRGFVIGLVSPFKFNGYLQDIKGSIYKLCSDIDFIKSELKTNGGSSIKDTVNRLELERLHEFWCKPFPAFRMNSSGLLLAASQVYLELVGASSEAEVRGMGWLQFVDPAEPSGDTLYPKLTQSLKTFSHFTGHQHVVSVGGESQGHWMLRVFPIGNCAGDALFSGAMYPVDSRAKDVARSLTWHNIG